MPDFFVSAVPRAAFDLELPVHQNRKLVACLGIVSYVLVLVAFTVSIYYFSQEQIPEIIQVPGPEYPEKCKSVDVLRGSYIETSPLSTFEVTSYFLIQFLTAFRYGGALDMKSRLSVAVVDRLRAFMPLGSAPGMVLVDVSYRAIPPDYIFMFYSTVTDSNISGAVTWQLDDCPINRKYVYFNDASTSLYNVCGCDVDAESTSEVVKFNCSSARGQNRSVVGQVVTNVTKEILVDKVVSIVVNTKLELTCSKLGISTAQILADAWPIATLTYTVSAYVVLRLSRCLRHKPRAETLSSRSRPFLDELSTN